MRSKGRLAGAALRTAEASVFAGVGREDLQQVAAARLAGRNERAACHRIEVVVHQCRDLVGIAFSERINDGAMLLHRAFGRVRAAVERQRQTAAVGDLADVANEDRAVGHPRQQDVELRRQADGDGIRPVARGFFFGNVRSQFGELGTRQAADQLPYDQALQLDADVEGVARFLPARRGDHGDTVAAQLDQAFRRQLPESLTCDGAADAEPLAEAVFRQLGAGLESLLDDGASQGAADQAHPIRGLLPAAAASPAHDHAMSAAVAC